MIQLITHLQDAILPIHVIVCSLEIVQHLPTLTELLDERPRGLGILLVLLNVHHLVDDTFTQHAC